MEKILFVNACVRGVEKSRTLKIANEFLNNLDSTKFEVINRDLMATKPEYLSYDNFEKREELLSEGKFDSSAFKLAREFAAVDGIVIAAPFWEFLYPAILNAYFESVSIAGITFRYNENGSEGMCRAKKLTFITTCGSDFTKPEQERFKIGSKHISTLCNMYGIDEFEEISAEGLDILGADIEGIINKAINIARHKAINY